MDVNKKILEEEYVPNTVTGGQCCPRSWYTPYGTVVVAKLNFLRNAVRINIRHVKLH